MTQTLEAKFDGAVFRPMAPVDLQPDTVVQLVITVKPAARTNSQSFLQVARQLELNGPADWSERVDDYLNGESAHHDE